MLRIMVLNCQGWPRNSEGKKIYDIHQLLDNNEPDIFVGLESHLTICCKTNFCHGDFEIIINNASKEVDDQRKSLGRGVIVLARKGCKVQHIFSKL
jgi:hypothetical protein